MNSVGKGTCTILVFVSNGNTQKGTVMVNKRNAQIRIERWNVISEVKANGLSYEPF